MEFNHHTRQYWEEKDWQDLEKSESMADMYVIAKRIIDRMPRPIAEVCGPIANGGLGSIEGNLNVFNDTIIHLQNRGLNVFDQMPFEIPMQNLKGKDNLDKLVESIQNDFYMPILKSGLISEFYFIPSWESSIGAKWEHKKAKELGIKIIYL